MVPDIAGVAKGKLMPARAFVSEQTMRFPKAIFLQCINGEYPNETYARLNPRDEDMILVPDYRTIRLVPWLRDPTAQVIHDAEEKDGTPVDIAPRQVLKRVIAAYAALGLQPVVAPEIEFFLVKPNPDPDYPLEPPVGITGRAEVGRQSYSIDAVNEYSPMLDDFYDYCDAQEIDIDTIIHESGKAQLEVNLRHGDALQLADQVFFVKRTLRAAALKHAMRATFMAKPMSGEPGSAMHIHTSVVEAGSGANVFSLPGGEPSPRFFHFIGGLQQFLPLAMPLLAPYVNSYRRITPYQSAPINVHWGFDNRTAGLRVPDAPPDARRVENRVAGADTNPYLAMATSLACGLIGMLRESEPSKPLEGDAYRMPIELPRNLLEALSLLEASEALAEQLGPRMIDAFVGIKRAEFEAYMRVVSPWEREYLLANV